jgi:hypothetical protein
MVIKRPRKRTVCLTAEYVPRPPERIFAYRQALELLAKKLLEETSAPCNNQGISLGAMIEGEQPVCQ